MRSRALRISIVLALLGVILGWAQAGDARRAKPHDARARGQVAKPRGRHEAVVRQQIPAATHVATWTHGSWCWFGDPRAVHVVGRYDQTFVGWIDWQGRVTVGAYDASFGVIRSHAVGWLFHDDHGSPAIFVEPDKRLTVFYSGHNGSAMYYRTTLRPEDISAWGPVGTVPSHLAGNLGFTYPNPVLLPAESNKLYLFWRGSEWGVDYATRSVDGQWQPARHLIAAPGQRPYVKAASNGYDTIALAFTNGHPRERVTSVYYTAYRAGWLRGASGRLIAPIDGPSISPQRADVVYNGQASGVSSWVWDLALDPSGRPVILYATFPSPRNHVYWYARWNGQRWVSHFLTYAGPTISPTTIEQQYSGGMALDHSNPAIVYLSRKVGAHFEIEKWVTSDGGYRWSHTTVVRQPGNDVLRPVVARGSDGGAMSLLWLRGHYGDYTNYRTSIQFLK
jgi:hypothetical protein